MDLTKLKIDRGTQPQTAPSVPRARTGVRGARSPWFGRLVALAVLGGLAWVFHQRLADLVDRFRLPLVETTKVELRAAAHAAAASGVAANGYVIARVKAALSADTPGRIVELNVTEGMAVKKGFVIARLYSEDIAAAVRRAEADLDATQAAVVSATKDIANWEKDAARIKAGIDTARAEVAEARAKEKQAELEWKRVQKMVADDTENARRLEEATADYDTAKARTIAASTREAQAEAAATQAETKLDWARAQLKEAEAQIGVRKAELDQAAALLDKTVIKAPFDGIIVLKEAEVGEVVAPSVQAGGSARGAVVTMVDFKTLEAQAEVPETSLKAVVIGAPSLLFLDAYPEHAFHGTVQRIWPTANRQKATVEVRVSIDDPDDRLRPEMGIRVVFAPDDKPAASREAGAPDADSAPVLMVPEEAIVRAGGRTSVFVIERDTAHERDVKLGGKTGGRYVVESGLAVEERCVLNPPPSLKDGDRVRVKENG